MHTKVLFENYISSFLVVYKSLQKELNGVNSLLKLDPGNVTLLTQKQELLTKSIEATKEKLEILTEAQKQAQEQFEKGEITEEQYRDLQREIVATEQKLEKLTDEFKEFGSVGAQQLAQLGNDVKDVGEKVSNFGKGFSVVSAGAGAVLTGSIAAFKQLDSGYDTIITKTGATGEALEELNAVADNIFGSMPTDMDTVGIAVGEVNTRFGYTGEQLETLSTQFIQFAEINGVDLNNSIGAVDKILEQFNVDASEAGNVLDLVTLKAQQTGIGADALIDSIQKNGATFKDMGIGVNEAVVLLAQFEANGVNVETAVKGLQKATNEYAKDGLSMEESLRATIDSIKNAGTETEALAIAQEVFGTKGANEMAKAIREGRISVDDLSTSMTDYAGVVSNTYAATLDPIDQGTVAMNNLKLAGSELGGAAQTALAPILSFLAEKLKDLANWFSNLSPGMQTTIVTILGIVTALGPLIIIIGQLITSIGSIMTFAPQLVSAFGAVKTAFTTLGTAFAANPIGIVIAAVAALVAGFILLWNNCEGFREFWINLWEKIKEICSAAVDWLCDACLSIGQFFSDLWDGIVNGFWAVVDWFREAAASIGQFFVDLGNAIVDAFWAVVEWFREAIASIGQFFVDLWDGIVSVFSTVGTWFRDSVITPITECFKLLWSTICSGASSAWSGIKNAFSATAQWFGDIFSKAWSAIKSVFSNFGSFFSGLWDGIKNTFSKIGTKIGDAISGAVKSGINGVINMIEKIINGGIKLINGAIGLINKIPGVSIGKLSLLELPRLARGGIVNRPTLAEIGEDGAEAVIPLENNTEWLDKVAQRLNRNDPIANNAEVLNALGKIYDRLDRLQVVLNNGVLVGEILDDIDMGLADKQLLRARGV